MSSDYGIKVSKGGVDVKTANPKDLIFSSQFDSMKIMKTGTLSLVIPYEYFGGGPDYQTYTIHTTSYTHNLGYIPFVLPRTNGEVAYSGVDVGTGGDYIVNDLEEMDIPRVLPYYFYGITTIETALLLVTNTQLILRITRENYTGDYADFRQRTATLYYTIFHNRVDETFNLL